MPQNGSDNYRNYADGSPEAISHYIADQLNDFRGQEINDSIIEAVRMRVAESLGGLITERQQWQGEAHRTARPILDGIKVRSPEQFSEITSRGSLIVREHFDEQARLDPDMAKNYIRAFHKLVDGDADPGERLVEYRPDPATSQLHHQRREPKPLPGIIVVKREDAYLHGYRGGSISEAEAKVLAEYGIVAGSILDELDWLRKSPLGSQKQKTLQALQHFVIALGEQIDANEG